MPYRRLLEPDRAFQQRLATLEQRLLAQERKTASSAPGFLSVSTAAASPGAVGSLDLGVGSWYLTARGSFTAENHGAGVGVYLTAHLTAGGAQTQVLRATGGGADSGSVSPETWHVNDWNYLVLPDGGQVSLSASSLLITGTGSWTDIRLLALNV